MGSNWYFWCPYARNEYFSYLPLVFQMLIKDKPKERMVKLLNTIVKDNIGLIPRKERTEEVVEILIEYKEKIYNES